MAVSIAHATEIGYRGPVWKVVLAARAIAPVDGVAGTSRITAAECWLKDHAVNGVTSQ